MRVENAHTEALKQDSVDFGLFLRFCQGIGTLGSMTHNKLCDFLSQSKKAEILIIRKQQRIIIEASYFENIMLSASLSVR